MCIVWNGFVAFICILFVTLRLCGDGKSCSKSTMRACNQSFLRVVSDSIEDKLTNKYDPFP